jgi:hypothetical protein
LRRTAELQAHCQLVKDSNPVTFVCNGDQSNVLVVNYFETDQRTATVERGDPPQQKARERDGEATVPRAAPERPTCAG